MTIRATGLTIRYHRGWRRRPFDALTAIDLEVRDGDFLALIGQNGAGKSTMMHAILGLVPPTAGTVEVFGRSPSPGASMFRQIGYLPEEPRYHEYLSVLEAATYYARLSGIRAPQSRVMELLDQLGLAEHRTTLIRRCSKGMKQKVGIVQCLIHRPCLLLLDEPMRGLDPLTVHLFRDMLLEMNRQGTTIVMNSHLLGEAEQVANRVAIVERGRLIANDAMANLLRSNVNRYTVSVESTEVPPFVEDAKIADGTVTGLVAAEQLYPFMEHARDRGLRLLACALERQSLEASFVEIIKQKALHG